MLGWLDISGVIAGEPEATLNINNKIAILQVFVTIYFYAGYVLQASVNMVPPADALMTDVLVKNQLIHL